MTVRRRARDLQSEALGKPSYYDLLDELSGRLLRAGESGWAHDLTEAKRSGHTSSEILMLTGTVLRRLENDGTSERLQLKPDIESLRRLAYDLFHSRRAS